MVEKYPVVVKLIRKSILAPDVTLKEATVALAADEQGNFWNSTVSCLKTGVF